MNVVAFSNVSLAFFSELFVPLVVVLCCVENCCYKCINQNFRLLAVHYFDFGCFYFLILCIVVPVAICVLIWNNNNNNLGHLPIETNVRSRTHSLTRTHARTAHVRGLFNRISVFVFLIITAIITGCIHTFWGPTETHCSCARNCVFSIHCKRVKIKSALHRARKIKRGDELTAVVRCRKKNIAKAVPRAILHTTMRKLFHNIMNLEHWTCVYKVIECVCQQAKRQEKKDGTT